MKLDEKMFKQAGDILVMLEKRNMGDNVSSERRQPRRDSYEFEQTSKSGTGRGERGMQAFGSREAGSVMMAGLE